MRAPTGQVIERNGKRGRAFAIRFRAYGERHYVTLGTAAEGWTPAKAEQELANVLADVRRGLWRPPAAESEPAAPAREPTFHEFASEWLDSRRHELRPRSIEALEWALSYHLLPYFKGHRLGAIDTREVDRYRAAKLREREHGLVERPLSNGSINTTLKILGQVLDAAVEYGLLETNPARGRRRRLKAERPRRTWLALDEVKSLLDAAGGDRAFLATLILSGLRIGEILALEWGAVDLARGKLRVAESKTDAGERDVDLSPDLRDELLAYRAARREASPRDLVFPTSTGRPQSRSNVTKRILGKAIERANAKRAESELPPIQPGVTNHTLRRTFASLLYEAGASPAYVMSQMGHTSSALALEIYARKMERERDTGARVDALIRGADWAQAGTNGATDIDSLPAELTLERGTSL